MVIGRYDVFLVALDPTIGSEVKKSRPCVVISPDEMNRHLSTVIIAPMTTQPHAYPTRVPVRFAHKEGWVMLDQIRTVDKRRLVKRLGAMDATTISSMKLVIQEMLVD